MALLGQIYPSALEALAQSVENCGDAGAKHIWVVIEPTGIKVIDDGIGMVPFMLPQDVEVLDSFRDMAEAGKLPDDFDIDKIISVDSPSRRSLQWMRECIAFSSKRVETTGSVRGMKGVGALAYLTYADQAVYYTKPNQDLLRANWGNDWRRHVNETFMSIPPSHSQLKRGNTDYPINATPVEQLADPWGRPLPHGTRLEAKGFLPGREEALKPNSINAFLRSRFGSDVKSGRYELTIVDRITTSTEREIRVEPGSYKGVLLVDEDFFVRSGISFHMQLWYDPNGRTGQVMVRHKASEKFPLGKLSSFAGTLWSNGRLSGFVDFPDYPNGDDLWDTSKTNLLPTPESNQWEKKLLELLSRIEIEINKAQQQFQDKEMREVSQDLSAAAIESMQELEAFSDYALAAPSRSRKPPGGGGSSPYVTVTVFDEYTRPLADVEAELWERGLLIDSKVTGISGKFSFGRRPDGDYRIKVVVPEGMSVLGTSDFQAKIRRDSQPGFSAIFHLKTGLAKRDTPKRFGKLITEFVDLGDPEVPYDHNLNVGIVFFNQGYPPLNDAFKAHDEAMQDALLAEFTAAAISDYVFTLSGGGSHSHILIQTTLLYATVLKNFRLRRAERKKGSSRRRA